MKNENNEKKWWIIGGISALIVLIIIIGIGLVGKRSNSKKTIDNSPTPSPNLPNPIPVPAPNPSVKSLPSEEEAQTKINQIKASKNLDDTQATLEFLVSYAPHINWWEINSLSELDEKIKLVNDSTSFSPFKEIPTVDKFNKETEENLKYKSLLFLATVIPRSSNNIIDWKGYNNFQEYLDNYLEPLLKNSKFKPAFVTHNNLKELEDRLNSSSINPQLVSICSRFEDLNKISDLNDLINDYLTKIFQGLVYSHLVEDFSKQLRIMGVSEYKLKKTGNHSGNVNWGIALNEFEFKK